MNLTEIERFIRHVEQHDIATFEYAMGSTMLRLRLADGRVATSVAMMAAPAQPPESPAITAPAAGHFLSIHPSATDRFIKEGAAVQRGQTIAFLRIGPCLRPVTAPADGVLGQVLAKEGALVGYGTRLFAFS
jgi:biotin carboxyl carrier protein